MNAALGSEPLSRLKAGCDACIVDVFCDPQGMRVREMGFCEGQRVEVLCAGDPMICRVGGCRVGICARLAAGIQVTQH